MISEVTKLRMKLDRAYLEKHILTGVKSQAPLDKTEAPASGKIRSGK